MLRSRITARCSSLVLVCLAAACGSSTSGHGSSAEDGGTKPDGEAEVDSGNGPDSRAPSEDAGASGDATADAEPASGDATPGDGAGADTRAHDGGAPDAAEDGPFVVVTHAPQPQVTDLGGSVLTTPKVQLIVYTADTTAPAIDGMVTELTQTATWATQTAEYGVGALSRLPTIQIAGTPPTTIDDNFNGSGNSAFQQTLVNNTTGASPAWGAADPSTIYMFVLPLGTNIESAGSCCIDFLGYHYEVTAGSVDVSYAIACDCGVIQGYPLTAAQWVETTVSHELVEAATDPHPYSAPAYIQEDSNDTIWAYATGGEVADMCEFNVDSNYIPPASTYMIQRTWSNAAAAAGTNPCVPVPPTGPFFNSMAVLPDTFALEGVTTAGVEIPVGMSKTIDVQLYSAAPTSGPWKVTAYDLDAFLGKTANTTVSLDNTMGSDGDVLHLTIQVTSADTNLGGEGFVLVSDLNGQENISVGAVGN